MKGENPLNVFGVVVEIVILVVVMLVVTIVMMMELMVITLAVEAMTDAEMVVGQETLAVKIALKLILDYDEENFPVAMILVDV